MYPTGVIIAPNGGLSCLSNYILQNNTCLRSPNSLTKLSTITNQWLWGYSSNGLNTPPTIGSSTYWSPSTQQLNEYISIIVSNGSPQIIFQIGIHGNSQGWVSGYIIQFRNKPNAPFICWNSCN
jgi:hypothetical protein